MSRLSDCPAIGKICRFAPRTSVPPFPPLPAARCFCMAVCQQFNKPERRGEGLSFFVFSGTVNGRLTGCAGALLARGRYSVVHWDQFQGKTGSRPRAERLCKGNVDVRSQFHIAREKEEE